MPADTSPPNFETLSDEKPGAGVTEEPLEAHDTLPAELATGDKLGDGAETMESDESNEVKAQVKTSPRAWAVLIATFTAQLFSWGFLVRLYRFRRRRVEDCLLFDSSIILSDLVFV